MPIRRLAITIGEYRKKFDISRGLGGSPRTDLENLPETPDDIQDLHFHIDDFKNGIEKEFAFLKEATGKNIENFQSSLSLQQTYSASLCSHVNNIYNKLAELQQQLPQPNPHMNTGDMIQIEAPDFDRDIDEALLVSMAQHTNDPATQRSITPTLKSPPAQDYRPANQAPGPHQTTQELMQIFDKGRGQARREELHGHQPFGARTRSLQSHIQRKIRKTQQMRQRYANAQ